METSNTETIANVAPVNETTSDSSTSSQRSQTQELTLESLLGGATRKSESNNPRSPKLQFSPFLCTINTNIPFRWIQNEHGEWIMTEDEQKALLDSGKALQAAAAELFEEDPVTKKHMRFLNSHSLQFHSNTRHSYLSLDAYWWAELGPIQNRLHIHIGINVTHKSMIKIARLNLAKAIRKGYIKFISRPDPKTGKLGHGRAPPSHKSFACLPKIIKVPGWEPAAYTMQKAKEYVEKNKHEVYNYKNPKRGITVTRERAAAAKGQQQQQTVEDDGTNASDTLERPSNRVVNHIMTNLDELGKTHTFPNARRALMDEMGMTPPVSSSPAESDVDSEMSDALDILDDMIEEREERIEYVTSGGKIKSARVTKWDKPPPAEKPMFFFTKNTGNWEDYDPSKDLTEEEAPFVDPPPELAVNRYSGRTDESDEETYQSTPEESIDEEHVLNPRKSLNRRKKRHISAAEKFKNLPFRAPRKIQQRKKPSSQTASQSSDSSVEIPVTTIVPSWV